MPELARAFALGFTVLIAQIAHVLPHVSHPVAPAPQPAAPVTDNLAGDLHTEQLTTRIALLKAKRPHPRRVVVPATGYGPAAPVPVHYSGTIAQIIQQAFAPQGQTAVNWAERVAMCESGDNPDAYNRSSGAAGLFQIEAGTWAGTPYAGDSEFDPVANAKAAAWIYARRGGSAWTCS